MPKLEHGRKLTISLPWQETKAYLKLTHVDNQFACFVEGERVEIADRPNDDRRPPTLNLESGRTTRILMIGINTGGPYKFVGSVQFDRPGHDIEINVEGPEGNGLVFWSELVVERKE